MANLIIAFILGAIFGAGVLTTVAYAYSKRHNQ